MPIRAPGRTRLRTCRSGRRTCRSVHVIRPAGRGRRYIRSPDDPARPGNAGILRRLASEATPPETATRVWHHANRAITINTPLLPPTPPRFATPRTECLLVVAGFALLAVVLTWPLALHLGSLGYRLDNGDGLFSVWNVAWVAHAVTSAPTTVFDANIFYPQRWTLAYSELNLFAGALGSPVYWLTGSAYAAANFVLVDGGTKARQIIDAMIAKGVFVRDRTKDPSTPTCFRITTGVVEHTRTAAATLEAVCARLR